MLLAVCRIVCLVFMFPSQPIRWICHGCSNLTRSVDCTMPLIKLINLRASKVDLYLDLSTIVGLVIGGWYSVSKPDSCAGKCSLWRLCHTHTTKMFHTLPHSMHILTNEKKNSWKLIQVLWLKEIQSLIKVQSWMLMIL